MSSQIIDLKTGKNVGTVDLSAGIFSIEEIRSDILTRVVKWQLAKRQAGTHQTKTISEISGTTKKPHKQKGTGSARQGSKRSPQMRGGATVLGPVSRSHAIGLPKKIRKLGLKMALSAKNKEGKLLVIKDAEAGKVSTKDLSAYFNKLGVTSALIIDAEKFNEFFEKSVANIKHVDILPSVAANVYDILKHETLILTENAVKKLEERLA